MKINSFAFFWKHPGANSLWEKWNTNLFCWCSFCYPNECHVPLKHISAIRMRCCSFSKYVNAHEVIKWCVVAILQPWPFQSHLTWPSDQVTLFSLQYKQRPQAANVRYKWPVWSSGQSSCLKTESSRVRFCGATRFSVLPAALGPGVYSASNRN
jgi:hypothetical protein